MPSDIILITGLSGSGKTTLTKELMRLLDADYFNGDEIRKKFNDWDFSDSGRHRQANRIRSLCKNSGRMYCLADFICPTNALRTVLNPSFVVWMNTIDKSIYSDTDSLFEIPSKIDVCATTKDAKVWAHMLIDKVGLSYAA